MSAILTHVRDLRSDLIRPLLRDKLLKSVGILDERRIRDLRTSAESKFHGFNQSMRVQRSHRG